MRAVVRTIVLVLFAALFISGCAEPNVREVSSTQLIFKPTSPSVVMTPPVTTITVPLANFKGTNSHQFGDQSDDAIQLCGWLYISEPYVNILEPLSPDWNPDVDFDNLDLETLDDSVEIYWLHLPRSGTRYHPPSQSLWVWGGEPMTNGDYVCTGGSGESPPTRYPRKIHESNPWYAPGLGLDDPPPINPKETH